VVQEAVRRGRTGVSRGIGQVIAEELQARGAAAGWLLVGLLGWLK
jgi:hypothetical protein